MAKTIRGPGFVCIFSKTKPTECHDAKGEIKIEDGRISCIKRKKDVFSCRFRVKK